MLKTFVEKTGICVVLNYGVKLSNRFSPFLYLGFLGGAKSLLDDTIEQP